MNRPVDLQAAALTGADAVVEMLKAHGVEVIFGLCGDTSLPLYDALARSGSIRHVLTRDERHAGYMADGYARVTGKVGVCTATSAVEAIRNRSHSAADAYTITPVANRARCTGWRLLASNKRKLMRLP